MQFKNSYTESLELKFKEHIKSMKEDHDDLRSISTIKNINEPNSDYVTYPQPGRIVPRYLNSSLLDVKPPIDLINKAPHYNQGRIEPIEVIEDWKLNYCAGNIIKYIARYKHKGKPIEDIKKLIWYANKLLKEVELNAAP